MGTDKNENVRRTVLAGYSTIAEQTGTEACTSGCCCGSSTAQSAEDFVKSIGYSKEELDGMPEAANLGLSCGNPTAIAALKEGETVLDLGSGGGFDAFIAARKVGASGRVIGVDMTPAMIHRARDNNAVYTQATGLKNVEFRLGEIEHLPVADASVDVVISNCVLNLSPDKPQVWKEIARVLKPGGRASISDLALLKPLPNEVLEMIEALVGCIAGAVLVQETKSYIQSAGLNVVEIKTKSQYIETMASFHDPLYQKIVQVLPAGTKPADYITSLDIKVAKPKIAEC